MVRRAYCLGQTDFNSLDLYTKSKVMPAWCSCIPGSSAAELLGYAHLLTSWEGGGGGHYVYRCSITVLIVSMLPSFGADVQTLT